MRTSEILLEWRLTEPAYRRRVETAAGPVDRWQSTRVPIVEITAAARLALVALVTPPGRATAIPLEEALPRTSHTIRGPVPLSLVVLELPGELDHEPDAGAATAAILAQLERVQRREEAERAAIEAAAAHAAGVAVLPDNVRRAAAEGRDVRPALEAWIVEAALTLIRGAIPPAVGYPVAHAGAESPRLGIPNEAAYAVADALQTIARSITGAAAAPGLPPLPDLVAEVGPIARFTAPGAKRTGVRLTLRHPWIPGGETSIIVIAEPEPGRPEIAA